MARNVVLSLSESEILSELDGALAVASGPSGARTTQEIMAIKGWSNDKTLLALKALGKQGRLMVHQVQRPSLDGKMRWVPAYTIINKKK